MGTGENAGNLRFLRFHTIFSLVFSESFPKQALVFTCLQYKSFENTVGKGEIARNEQFLLFPKCFLPIWRTFCHFHQGQNCRLQTLSVLKSLKFVVWERVKGLCQKGSALFILWFELIIFVDSMDNNGNTLHVYLKGSVVAEKPMQVFNSLPNNKILDLSKFKAFTDDKLNVTQKLKFDLGSIESIVEKGENAGYQHFFLFPQ